MSTLIFVSHLHWSCYHAAMYIWTAWQPSQEQRSALWGAEVSSQVTIPGASWLVYCIYATMCYIKIICAWAIVNRCRVIWVSTMRSHDQFKHPWKCKFTMNIYTNSVQQRVHQQVSLHVSRTSLAMLIVLDLPLRLHPVPVLHLPPCNMFKRWLQGLHRSEQ